MAAREQAERAERERRNEALANGEHWKRKRDYVIELSPGELKNARVDERQGGPVEISTIEGPCTVLRLFAVVSNRWVIDEIEKLEKENKELHAKIERLKTVFEDAGL